MKRLLSFIIFLITVHQASAQRTDSLFVSYYDHGWAISYNVKAGETLFSLARRYHVPPAILADVNEVNYQSGLAIGRKVLIPLGAYNQLTSMPSGEDYRPIYYRVSGGDDLHAIARASLVSQRALQQWNGMQNNELIAGKVLNVGWVLYDNTSMPAAGGKPITAAAPRQPMAAPAPRAVNTALTRPRSRDTIIVIAPPQKDTVPDTDEVVISEAEREFLMQTSDGQLVNTEKGPVAFYGSATGGTSNFFYAFHNSVPKGTVIKVHNPGSGKTIYAKVLGPMPATRLYHNAVLGVSSKARAALGVTTEKAWCELSYSR